MMDYSQPFGAMNSVDSLNGAYGGGAFVGSTPAAAPATVAAGQQGADVFGSVPVVGSANATLVWWFVLLGLLVGAHVLTLKFQR